MKGKDVQLNLLFLKSTVVSIEELNCCPYMELSYFYESYGLLRSTTICVYLDDLNNGLVFSLLYVCFRFIESLHVFLYVR